jgi:hypothetical protein
MKPLLVLRIGGSLDEIENEAEKVRPWNWD